MNLYATVITLGLFENANFFTVWKFSKLTSKKK